MTRTELINYIIKKMGYKSYLEIGIGSGKNFEAIECEEKISIDPNPDCRPVWVTTSDNFFTNLNKIKLSDVKEKVPILTFDIIFIDGLHHADQVRKDIINSWECLNAGGCLLIHDSNPDREEITHVPRDSKEWCGDVYKAVHQIDGPPKFTLKDDHGVTVVRKTGPLQLRDTTVEWQGFDLFREVILKLVNDEEAKKIIDSWT